MKRSFTSIFFILFCIAPLFLGYIKPQNQLNNIPLDSKPRLQTIENESYQFDVIDIRSMSVSFDERLMLSSVEGLVNRNSPQMFLYYSEASTVWLQYINTTQYRGYNITFSQIKEIIQRYQSNFQGIVVFNSSNYDEVNLASPLAGYYNALLIPNSLYTTFREWFPSNYPILRNVTQDLIDKTSRVERYEYAVETYFPLCNQSAIALYAGDIAQYMRSFIIKNQLFTLWRVLYVHTDIPLEWGLPALDPDPAEERQFFEDFLNSLPGNIPIYGYMWADGGNEVEVMKRISGSNKYLISVDFFENLPFFNAMKLPEGYEFHQYRPSTYKTLQNKIYISGIWSDGDNIQYLYNFMRPNLWTASTAEAGKYPTGWTFNPSTYYLAPYVAKFYYENATTNDYFIGGLSGKGYTKMDYYTNQTIMTQFLQESQVLWDLMDMKEARIWQLENTSEIVVNSVNLEGIFDGYLGRLEYKKPMKIDNTPIIESVGVTGKIDDALDFVKNLKKLNPIRPQFYFFHLHCWLFTAEQWHTLAQALEEIDGVELVRPDELCNLMQQWNENGNEPIIIGIGIGCLIGIVIIVFMLINKAKQRKNAKL